MDRSVRTGILVIGVLVVAAALVAGLGMDWLFPKPQPAPRRLHSNQWSKPNPPTRSRPTS